MLSARQGRKRRRSNTPEMMNHTNSMDLTSDLAYLISYINSNDIFLWTLLSGQITNISFSDLYAKSQDIGWKEVLIEVRHNLKLDEKSKPKRLILNRLIEECSRNTDIFNKKIEILNEEMKTQMSNSISPRQNCDSLLQTINDVYIEVKRWRQLQCERRLFYKEYHRRVSLPILQRLITDYFIYLANSLRCNPNLWESGGREALKELFDHCLIMVVQPSGTDCIAVTKYEKIGKDFSVKIKTRMICLLDPHRIREYLQLFDVDLVLYLKDRKIDPEGEVQSSLPWQTRTIICDETEPRTFLHIELNENDSIKLRKKNFNRKLAYNNRLCQLELRIKFKMLGTNFEESIKYESQLFGLCSHAKYSPKYLTKVFLEEVKETYKNIHLATHTNALEGYIGEFHKRISGVDVKPHTREFIHNELAKVYASFCNSAKSPTAPVMFFTLDIYEDILDKFFTQMKFLGSHPFLSMMYHDSLFLGICDDTVDKQLNNNHHILMRFARFTEQEALDSPNIIFVIYHGSLSRSRVTHAYFITDMCVCIREAAKKEENYLQVFANSKILPFSNFGWYYDADLSRDNVTQMNDETKYFPLKFLLRDRSRNSPVQLQTSNEQSMTMMPYIFDLSGQITGNRDLTGDAIAFLQEQFTRWCSMQTVQGSLTRYSIENIEIGDGDLNEFLNENHS